MSTHAGQYERPDQMPPQSEELHEPIRANLRKEQPTPPETANVEQEDIAVFRRENRQVMEIEDTFLEKGILREEDMELSSMYAAESLASARKEEQMLQDDLNKMHELEEVIDVDPASLDTQEALLEKHTKRVEKLRSSFLGDMPEGGNETLTTPALLEELEERLQEFDLSLRKQREKAVLKFIEDATEWALSDYSSELHQCENQAKAKQLIIFTIYHGVLKQAQEFIQKGGEPNYSFHLQYQMVEHSMPNGDMSRYFTDIKLNFSYGTTSFELPEESKQLEEAEDELSDEGKTESRELLTEELEQAQKPEEDFVFILDEEEPEYTLAA